MSIRPLASPYAATSASIKEVSPNVFELRNAQYIVTVTSGAITSLYDISAQRELIPPGKKAGQLVLFDDKPLYWQAWDVEVYHLSSRTELAASKTYISSTSPHLVSLTIETPISSVSHATTTISLSSALSPNALSAIEFSAQIEWHETMAFLKVEFPVDIVSTSASYETQFGIVRRPTHYNTTWDMAKFEVCCHKWADLSEATYGVSILNDSKYGFAVAGNVMRLSLLRAPKAPDAHADMGGHSIRYAMLPHSGGVDSRTIRKAFEFNNPLRVVGQRAPLSAAGPSTPSLLSSLKIHGAPNLVLDTIKRGEDDEDVSRGELPTKPGHSVIVRIYDALGGKSRGVLSWGGIPVKKVVKVSALEDDLEDLSARIREVGAEEEEGGFIGEKTDGEKEKGVGIEVRAFEVLTLKLVLE